jgi:hypothetical protein
MASMTWFASMEADGGSCMREWPERPSGRRQGETAVIGRDGDFGEVVGELG